MEIVYEYREVSPVDRRTVGMLRTDRERSAIRQARALAHACWVWIRVLGAEVAEPAASRPRVVAIGSATFALLAARAALERVDSRLSALLDRLPGAPVGPGVRLHARALRASASRRLSHVVQIASDLSREVTDPHIEIAAGRVLNLAAHIEAILDAMVRDVTDRGRASS